MWDRFKADIIGPRASVQPLAGWLLTALFGFVIYLTLVYAPGAFERARLSHGEDPNGVIPVWAGYLTVAIVSGVTLLVAFEPWRRFVPQRSAQQAPERASGALGFIVAAPGVLLSALDTFLVRGIAAWVGAAQHDVTARHLWGFVFIATMGVVALFAPPLWGLTAAALGVIAVIAVVRRWSWIESDRETFLIERGIRPGAMRIGFEEDLRDEALIGIVCLFALIPLMLRQVQLIDPSAFALNGELPSDPFGQFFVWLGFFGAELAKSVPFVDWSEVFHVANDSPIEPGNAMGAQFVFAMRATLDLMLLAAVVQAVGIATRIADQNEAFRNNRLPILEPFSEARELAAVGAQLEPALEVQGSKLDVVQSFPEYQRSRLLEVVADSKAGADVRIAAAAILMHQHSSDVTMTAIRSSAALHADAALRERLDVEANPLLPHRSLDLLDGDRKRLLGLIEGARVSALAKTYAAIRIGRIGFDAKEAETLLQVFRKESDPQLRAHIALAIAKRHADGMDPQALLGDELTRFASAMRLPISSPEEIKPAMIAAHALARLGHTADEVAATFTADFRPYVTHAAQVQSAPLSIEQARAREIGASTDQMVALRPGTGPFPPSFTLGAVQTGEGARKDQTPAMKVDMTRPFAIGRFPVTNREYAGYRTAQRLPPVEGANRTDMPVVNITWRDALLYAQWLESFTGDRYRLLSEAEWEYACRAGTTSIYWWGDEWDEARIPSGLTAVNKFEPNPWGVWDLYGNVYEWCADHWHGSYEGRKPTQDPWIQGGDPTRRVVRGGSWSYPTGTRRRELRSSYRNERQADATATNFGFRLARTLYD